MSHQVLALRNPNSVRRHKMHGRERCALCSTRWLLVGQPGRRSTSKSVAISRSSTRISLIGDNERSGAASTSIAGVISDRRLSRGSSMSGISRASFWSSDSPRSCSSAVVPYAFAAIHAVAFDPPADLRSRLCQHQGRRNRVDLRRPAMASLGNHRLRCERPLALLFENVKMCVFCEYVGIGTRCDSFEAPMHHPTTQLFPIATRPNPRSASDGLRTMVWVVGRKGNGGLWTHRQRATTRSGWNRHLRWRVGRWSAT